VGARLNTIGRSQGLTDTFYVASTNRILSILWDGAVTIYFVVLSTDKIISVMRNFANERKEPPMPTYKCPVCGKPLTKAEYERSLKIHEAREEHLHQLEESLKKEKRELSKKIDEAKRQARQQEKKRAERLMAGWKNRVKTLEDRIRRLEKGSTPQTEGLEFEGKLAARLKREFHDDDIQH
jgi:DNA repair exonuclease SbcCD ATPase subunit